VVTSYFSEDMLREREREREGERERERIALFGEARQKERWGKG
jgi:hypothetical protein